MWDVEFSFYKGNAEKILLKFVEALSLTVPHLLKSFARRHWRVFMGSQNSSLGFLLCISYIEFCATQHALYHFHALQNTFLPSAILSSAGNQFRAMI